MKTTYPSGRESDVALRDGFTVHVRPIRPQDERGVLEFLRDLSPESRAFRFFSGGVDLEGQARRFVDVDYHDQLALVATAGTGGKIVGHAAYHRLDKDSAEVAFAVAEAFQGRGLGTILLAHLAEAAQEAGIALLRAEILPSNHQMVEMLRESGFSVRTRSEPGAILAEFPTALGPNALYLFDKREQTAAVAALKSFLCPRSVAVIGASRSRGTIGGEVFHNLMATGFNGPVFPVNPKAPVVQSVVAYPSVLDVPGPVDLAVIVVPAPSVLEVVRQCAAKGVRGIVVISANFAEAGPPGAERQRELLGVCRESGMRLIGPNCMGILNADPEVRLNATFAPVFPPRGRVGFLSQSGALGLAVIDYASSLGLGISSFVSVGNKADISGNDLLNYWEVDGNTDVIVLYLESFGNPRKFSRISRRVGKEKPIIAVKSGRSAAGARATASHTGALIAASDVTVDALFKQTGVIRTDTLHGLFDIVSLLANQPVPSGKRVGILTNAGGPGILCADACEANGLQVVPLPEDVQRRLAEFLPAEASLANPVDMIASASGEDYRRAIGLLAAHDGLDALIVIFIPPLITKAEEVARAIRTASQALTRKVPILTVFMSARGIPSELRGEATNIPSFAFPEDAAFALARAVEYGFWRRAPEGKIPEFQGIRRDEAAAILATALTGGPRWLTPEEISHLLACYGLRFAETHIVQTAEQAALVAEELGGPVALKAVAPTLIHKTEVGGVRLSLVGGNKVKEAAEEMARSVSQAGHRVGGYLVQRMVPPGVEMLVGVTHDAIFGPVVACGAGGTVVELLKDVSVRLTPLTDRDVSEMIRGLATYPLLEGFRGARRADIASLAEILLRVSSLVEDHPEVAEMDCNPVVVLPEGAVIVDARIRVEAPAPRIPMGARTPAPIAPDGP